MTISHGDELRENLARLLKANDKRTLGFLEKKAGVDRSVISRILSYETKNPQLKTIMKLEKAIHEIENRDVDHIRKSPIDSRVRDTISAATENEDSDSRKHLDETQKYAITRSAFSAHVYSYISANNGKKKIYPEDVLAKFGRHHKAELDQLLESRVLMASEEDGHLVPQVSNIAIEDSYFFLKLAKADLDYFDSAGLGSAAAMARRNGTTSKEGIDAIRAVVYDALVKIAEIPSKHPGDIAFHTNMFANVYDCAHFNEERDSEKGSSASPKPKVG